MNIKYLPTVSMESGLKASKAAWKIVRPNPDSGEITTQLYEVIEDVSGRAWSVVDLDYVVNVPVNSTGLEFIATIQEAIDAGILASSDLNSIRSAITAAQGSSVTIASLLPQDLIAQGMSYDDMVAAGNLSQPEGTK